MGQRTVTEQVLVEHEILNHLMTALRTILDWKIQEYDLSRKLTSLLFIAQSFQRHLEHVMELEEREGYIDMLTMLHPHMDKQVTALKRDHQQFRQMLDRIMPRLERISATDHATMGMMCDELRVLLARLNEHSGKETELIERLLMCGDDGADQPLAASKAKS